MYLFLNITQKLGDNAVCLFMHPTAILKSSYKKQSELQNVNENKTK